MRTGAGGGEGVGGLEAGGEEAGGGGGVVVWRGRGGGGGGGGAGGGGGGYRGTGWRRGVRGSLIIAPHL